MKAGEAVKHSPGCGPGHRNQSYCCCSSHYVTEATLRLFFGFSLTDPIELLPWHVKKRGSPPPRRRHSREIRLYTAPHSMKEKSMTPPGFFSSCFSTLKVTQRASTCVRKERNRCSPQTGLRCRRESAEKTIRKVDQEQQVGPPANSPPLSGTPASSVCFNSCAHPGLAELCACVYASEVRACPVSRTPAGIFTECSRFLPFLPLRQTERKRAAPHKQRRRVAPFFVSPLGSVFRGPRGDYARVFARSERLPGSSSVHGGKRRGRRWM